MQIINGSETYIPPCPMGAEPSVPIGSAGYNTQPQGYINYNPYGNQYYPQQNYQYYQQQSSLSGMNGYYNNNYGYYNPYLEEQLQKQKEAQEREYLRQQADVMKLIGRAVAKQCGKEVTEEMLSIYDPVTPTQISQEDMEYYELMELAFSDQPHVNPLIIAREQSVARFFEHRRTLYDVNATFEEFMEQSINLVEDMQKEDERRRQIESFNHLYDKDKYKKMTQQFNTDADNYFMNMYQDTYDNNVSRSGKDLKTTLEYEYLHSKDPNMSGRSPLETLAMATIPLDDKETVLPPFGVTEDTINRKKFIDKLLNMMEERNKLT